MKDGDAQKTILIYTFIKTRHVKTAFKNCIKLNTSYEQKGKPEELNYSSL